jgi:hypothetical protein
MGTTQAMSGAFVGFSSIAALTWFFSSRPRLYLLVFVPRDEWLGVARNSAEACALWQGCSSEWRSWSDCSNCGYKLKR